MITNLQPDGTANVPAVTFDDAALLLGLADIADHPLFGTWGSEHNPRNPAKPRKVPYIRGGNRLTGSYSDPALPSKLMTLPEAIAEREALGKTGVGIVFYPGCGVVGLDLDHCLEDDKNVMGREQKLAYEQFRPYSFIERSVSGTGVHAIALGDAKTHKANGSVELFANMNFLALTGAAGRGVAAPIPPENVAEVDEIIDLLLATQKGAAMPKVVAAPPFAAAGMASMLRINLDVLGSTKEARNPERAMAALPFVPSPPDRDGWFKIATAACAAGVSYEATLAWSLPGSDHDLRAIYRDYDPERVGGITAATFFKAAFEGGWIDTTRPVASVPGSVVGDAVDAAADSAGGHQTTDVWLSGVYVKSWGDKFRYDHGGKHYRMYRTGSWVPCQRGEQIEEGKLIGAKILAKAVLKLRADPDSKVAKRLHACGMRANSAGGIMAALGLAQSDPAIAVSAEDFDKDPALFNCVNGVIDLRTGVLLPHSPALMVFRQSPVEYDPAALCPLFDKFMLEISMDDPDWVEFMQRVMGYCLSGYVTEEKMFFWLGTGANGKSVLGGLQQYVMGGYGGVAPAAFLMHQREGNSNGATPDIANLAGRRMVAANEVEQGARMSGQTVKNAVSTEMITARVLYGPPFAFSPTHKLNVRGNHRPGIVDNDEGLWRRIALIPFDRNVPPEQRDQGLEARLRAEAPGILAWMVRGFQNWQREGLRPARRVLEASLAYRRDSDLLVQWVDERCVTRATHDCDQITAYRNYRIWAESQGLRPITKTSFTRGLTERGFKAGRLGSGTRGTTSIGFRLNTA